MGPEAMTGVAIAERLHLRVAWLCGAILFLEGYDIAATGYAVPSLVDAWKVLPQAFTPVLTAGNVGLLLGSLCAGLLGDRLGRRPVLIGCAAVFGVFSLLSAFAHSPIQLTALRFPTGLGLGGGVPLAVALVSDFAPPMAKGRLVVLMSTGVPIGFTVGGFLASQLVGLFGWPAIFVTGGVLPLAMVPLLALWLPESAALREATHQHNLVPALFQSGLAPGVVLLWAINLLSLRRFLHPTVDAGNFAQHGRKSRSGDFRHYVRPGRDRKSSAHGIDRRPQEIERVLTYRLALGTLCVLSIGLFNPRSWLLSIVICGAGIGGGCQAGINSLSALACPPAIRSTGARWAQDVSAPSPGRFWAACCWRSAFGHSKYSLRSPSLHSARRC
jgi:AAHS family 4-hydroxybenzoate transporter-like MFS transporter